MGERGRPPGSQTSRHRPFQAALVREIEAAGRDPDRLDKIARALLSAAERGEGWAIGMVADRLDGKVAQVLEHGGLNGGPIVTETRPVTDEERARALAVFIAKTRAATSETVQ